MLFYWSFKKKFYFKVHLGGKPIKFNFDGKIQIKSVPKDVSL